MSTSEPVMVNNGDRTYVSLHTHSTHSIGDGISTPDDLAKRAAELGMPAMALTDHGRMSGLVSFEKACHEHNVKPIMGMEAYCCGIGRSRTERKNYTMDTRDLVGKPGHEKSCYHLILLAKDETGYDNLCRLTTESYATGFYYKPRIDYGLLHEHRDGLIVCSACVLGELSMAVQDDDIDKARRVIDWFRGEFGDDYFVEVQNHGLPMELNAMRTLRELADDSDVRTIVTNDSHYTLKGDAKLQKTVMLINRHKSWADADVRGSFFDDASVDGQRAIEDEHGGEGDSDPIFETSSELYVKSYDEMVEALRPNGGEDGRVERELANTLEIAERCEYEIPFIDPSDTDAYFLPKYDVTTDVRYEEYERSSFAIPDYITKACVKELRDEGHEEVNEVSDYLDASDMEALRFLMWLCEDGMRRRVIPKIDAGGNPMPEEMWIRNKPEGMHVIHTHKSPDEQWVRHQVEVGRTRDDMIQEYRDRLAYETGVVVAKRFVNYFLIVQSYVNYVRAQGEMVGPGRGSGAGSLLNYLSGITSVDPIPNDLLFFRFLNKDRKGYPDIDVDFSSHGRDDILWPHLREVYGKDSTAMVAAYTYFWGKAAIKAASRVLFDCSSCRTMTPEQRRAGKDESIMLSNALCDLIDNRPHLDLRDELTDETDANGRPLGNEPLKALIKTDRRYQQIIDLALMLQGMISGESQHASAYILSPHPIVDKLPLMVSKDERERSTTSGEPVQDYIIQYDGREIQDQLGYVKMDLLCINDLEVITQTIKKIHDAYGVDIDIDNIPFDCKTTFDLLRQGKTAGVFQFDGSPVPKRLITEGKADSLNDLSMINALDRPGALNMGMDKEFIERKKDKSKIKYFSPDAEEVLKKTYGLACVARDSIVMTSDGEKPIQDIRIGDKVLAEDCQWHNVSAWYDKGIRETLRIHTDFGGELVCTPDHKILTSDGWVRADQLRKGMLIKGAMPSDMPDGVNNVRSIEPLDLQDWLIGLFIADGHSPKHGVPNISCGSRENAERIAEIARTVLPDMQNIHLTMTDGREHGSGMTWHVVFSQTPSGTHNGHFGKQAVQNDMNALLKQYGLFGKVKDEKKWPEKYSFSTIIGIIEGDGTDQTQILTLKHHDLAYSVYKALLEYGIHASIYLRGDKLAWIVSYSDIEHRIRPIARDYSGHDGCNGYYIPRKYLERYHYDRNIPYCVRKRYLGGTKSHMTPGVNIVKVRQHFGWSCHDDEHPTWGKILSVIPDGMHHVYDITVDDNHSFLCNDLFLSNCFQESLMLLSENKNIVGFTPGEADTMRKILAHKDQSKINDVLKKAHERAAQNNVPEDVVNQFCDMAEAAGKYNFNSCLSGDTLLYRSVSCWRDKKFPGRSIPVEEVYRRFNASAARNSPDAPIRSKYRSKDPNIGLFVICRDDDGRARRHKVKNVFKQGVQPLYEVRLENGKSGKFTANHRLQVADGSYKRVDELVVGDDELWCCDFVYEKHDNVGQYNWSEVRDGHHKGSRAVGKHNYGVGKDSAFYTNGGYTMFKAYHDAFDGVCECCGKRLEPGERYETHHIDGNRQNNEASNLENLCVSCHKRKHYAMGRVKRGQKGYPTYLSKIVSIEYVGEDMTYDVEIDSVEHNFFANGICSHNSHSLAYALIAYRGAFLKTFFPDCFLSSVAQIKPQMKGKDKIPDYLNEARQLGVELRPPHVNWSDIGFSVPEPHVIAYGLERIKGVGAAAQTIVDERHAHGEFTDITDFCCRVPKSVTKTALKALVSAGALDNLGWTRRALEVSVGDLAEFRKKWFKEREKNVGQLSLGLDIGTSVSATGDGSDDAGRTVSDVDAFYADGRHHNDHGTILMPPTTEEFPPYQMMEREHEAFGMYFSVTPEDWSQLARLEADEWLEGKRKESARQNREGVEIGGKRYRIINVSDVPSLPDSMRVVFTAMVEDVTPKFGDTRGYRLFKSGKGATVFLIDWGVGAEGRFGFSPSESRVRLTCFERVWNGMPKPSPNAVVLVWGRVNVSDKFPTSVIADGVRTLQYDAVRFQGRKERADELMGRLRDIAARASDPSSVAYLIPRVSLPDRNAYDRFVADPVMHAKYDDLYGMAIVTYDGCADDDSDRVMRLAQTVGMVRYARDKYGATVTKVRLPMAESELARRF
jgi:DNA polymerase III alpha subunit/intein/homing endonuclease